MEGGQLVDIEMEMVSHFIIGRLGFILCDHKIKDEV